MAETSLEERTNSKFLRVKNVVQQHHTTSDDEESYGINPAIPGKPKYKFHKIAIFFAYCGVGYQGMQKNPGAKTIEGDLEEALYLSGAVTEADRGQPKRFDFARSARTDKGVSAVGQVVSGGFYVDPPGLLDRLNSNLPPQIRIFGYKRAAASFNAKKFCDGRRYVYLIPVFALDPSCHRDRESVLASVGSGKELVKCLECSERGRKVFGVMGKRWWPKTAGDNGDFGSGISSNSGTADQISEKPSNVGNGNEFEGEKDVLMDPILLYNNGAAVIEEKIVANSSEIDSGYRNGAQDIGETMEANSESEFVNCNGKSEKNSDRSYCYGEAVRERFNRILKHYEGKHNFHNFTTRMKADDPAANRHIISFNANTALTIDGIDFVKCEVVGQSFMLHQIRKMVGLAIAIMRNCASESLIQTAFREDVNINVPMAPEVGLYLEECFFTSYNQKFKDTYEDLSIKAYAEEAEEFKLKHIYSHIASAEHKDGAVALWLHSLNYRNYPDLRVAYTSEESFTRWGAPQEQIR
ncbi:uncharacterized protein LOC127257062 isoform X2 [Andrographis paniculata]|nr:uncharacterized protein LOC127257062 isoform X2 [Andrographis paniculata]